MWEGVAPNGFTFRLDPPRFGRERLRHLAHHKKRRLDALRGEYHKNSPCIARRRPVIKGDDYFVVGKGQRFGILHRTDAAVLYWVNSNDAADAERVGLTIALHPNSPHPDRRVR